ncbi:MAG: WG repeat-containing protein [Clostridia bacterium]|nr:WG repeat-containing protein [Clostridia bacterium]
MKKQVNRRGLLSFGIVFLLLSFCAGGWFLVLSEHRTDVSELAEQKALANEKYEKQIYDEALAAYKTVLATDPDDLISMERVADIYQKTGQDTSCIAWCERVLHKDPSNLAVRLLEARSYDGLKKVKSAISVLQKALKSAGDVPDKDPKKQEIKAYLLELEGRYELSYLSLSWAAPWFPLPDGSWAATVGEENALSVYSAKGKEVVTGPWSYLGASADDDRLFPVREGEQWYFVDGAGERRLVPDGSYLSLYAFSEGLAPAKRLSGPEPDAKPVAGYLDKTLKEQRFEFEEAYPMESGKALVKKDGAYQLLDSSLQEQTVCAFTAVKVDPYGRALRYGRFIGRLPAEDGQPERWGIFAEDGQRVGDFSAEEIRLPESKTGPLAFCQEGLWGYVSRDGEMLIEPVYEETRSFSKGLGAFRQDGKWGYLNKDGEQVIPPTFEDALPFSEQGSAFVKNTAGYSLLTLSRYMAR